MKNSDSKNLYLECLIHLDTSKVMFILHTNQISLQEKSPSLDKQWAPLK